MRSSRISPTVRRRVDYRPTLVGDDGIPRNWVDAVDESIKRASNSFAVDSAPVIAATLSAELVARIECPANAPTQH
jgi:hypothetical protein